MKNITFQSALKEFKRKFKNFNIKADDTELKKSYKELETAYKKLNHYKNNLEIKVNEEIDKRVKNEKFILEKTRFISMGEMMDAIAHQWVQPLTLIAMYNEAIRHEIKNDTADLTYIFELLDSVKNQKEHLQTTLEDFRNFLNPLNEEQSFELSKIVKKSLSLIEDDLIMNHINITYDEMNEIFIKGNPKEIKHLIINIINNAKDVCKNSGIKDCHIKISVKIKETKVQLIIKDNAGGIDELMLEKIFLPYTTTKKESGGSGIGLYICKLIMQKHGGDIEVKNANGGAKFIITFHKKGAKT